MLVFEVTIASLFTIEPGSFVYATILPSEFTLTVPFVILKESLVLFAVRPD